MYFSKHNKNITYINHYSGLLEVEGEGVLCREDTELWLESRMSKKALPKVTP